jgi:uncharacterized protein (DUF2236 family)
MATPRFVNKTDLVHWLGEARRHGVDNRAGLFGPDSMMWHVGRESISFLGGGRAALLQLAHPWVANAIDQHSATRNDPLGRFQRTFINVFTMLFGSLDQVEQVSRRVHNIHTGIKGELPEDSGAFARGSYYQANEAHAMFWVHATLWDTQMRMYELVYPALSPEEKDIYYQETKLFAWLFGIPDELIPEDWRAFQAYMDAMYDSDVLTVSSVGREMGDMIFSFDLPFAKLPLQWLRTITAELMPERLAREFGLPADSADRRKTLERSLRWIRRVYPRLPGRLRYVPPYQEALGRLSGRHRADWATRQLNRVWVGQPELVSE